MGNCYKANTHLFLEMIENGIDAMLCHGIVVAPPLYNHMKPGTRFMHCWVEARSKEHGNTYHDVSDNVQGVPDYQWVSRAVFETQMSPRFVVKMSLPEVRWNIEKNEWYGEWDLHPEHRLVNR